MGIGHKKNLGSEDKQLTFDIQKGKHVEEIKERGCMVNVTDTERGLCCSVGARLLLSREKEAAVTERQGDWSPMMWFSSGNG